MKIVLFAVLVLFTGLYFTLEPIKVVEYEDGSKYVVETSQGKTFRELTDTDLQECRITYIKG